MLAKPNILGCDCPVFNYFHKMNLFLYRCVVFVLGLWSFSVHAQTEKGKGSKKKDTAQAVYYIIAGDTIARDIIDLDEVVLMEKLRFRSASDRRNYLILQRKTRKVYPYAKLAAERLTIMSERLSKLEKKSDKRKYTKIVQRYVEEEFTDTLKSLTRSEGQILVKLIHRQTGQSAFDLIKELRTGWKAFWSNATANLFDISLKEEYRPFEVKEDYLIEDILQRSFRENRLERQSPHTPIDFLDLSSHWKRQTDGGG